MEKFPRSPEGMPSIERVHQFNLDSIDVSSIAGDRETLKDSDEKPRIRLYFIRHGVHLELPDDEKNSPLQDIGVEEARDIGRRIQVDEKQAVAFYVDNLRSQISTSLAINSEAQNLEQTAQEYVERGKIKSSPELQYKQVKRTLFGERLAVAVKLGKVLKFLVEDSDEIAGYDIGELSTYSTISKEVAKILIKYLTVQQNWERLNDISSYKNKTLYRIFCGREYIYGCFRAMLTENILGAEQRDEFVEWYEAQIENKEEGRKMISEIIIETEGDGPMIILKDAFGSLKLKLENLDVIIGRKLEAIREASYVLPIRENAKTGTKEVAVIKYADGIGFIGGRIDASETPEQGLIREIQEELGESGAFFSGLKPIQKNYSFKMKVGARPNEDEHKEKHHFYLLDIHQGKDLTFKEAGASIIWIPVVNLCQQIKYSDLRNFIEKYIIPEI